jgi:transposase
MKDLDLFTKALGLEAPWQIKEVTFEMAGLMNVLHITLSHSKGAKFNYEGEDCPVYDHQVRHWRHLDFFQHHCYLHADVPRVKLRDGKVRLVEVPWACAGSSFSELFEAKIRSLIQEGMSVSGSARHLRTTDKRVFGVVSRSVSHALATQDIEPVGFLSIDETSSRKGHNYLTILCDREEKKVIGIGIGKDKEAVSEALTDMEIRGGERETVREITMDMSKSYIAAADEYFEQADITFDRFHITKKLNEAIDEIRRNEQKEFNELKKSRYLWLKNHQNLKATQQEDLEYLISAYPTIGEAYRLKEMFRDIIDNATKDHRLKPLNVWMKMAWNSDIKPLRKFVNMLKTHWYGVKNYFKRLATNAFAERVNLKIQEIKRIAKGYRNINNYKLMIYFHLGGLDFD